MSVGEREERDETTAAPDDRRRARPGAEATAPFRLSPGGRSSAWTGPWKAEPPAPPRPPAELSKAPRYLWAGRLGTPLVLLWGKTLRVEWDLPPAVLELERQGGRHIHAFWHQHILPLTYFYRNRGIVVLVSSHGDGEIITQIIHRLGFGTVRGSSTRGGMRALLEMARLGERGHPLSVTPDGPRGPRQRLQPGVLLIAQRSGLPLVPYAVGARRCKRLRSWDRFELPWFFSRVLVTAGEPLSAPPGLSAEALVSEWGPEVERRFREVEERAEAWSSEGPRREGRPPSPLVRGEGP